jgi:hypothetical protein
MDRVNITPQPVLIGIQRGGAVADIDSHDGHATTLAEPRGVRTHGIVIPGLNPIYSCVRNL